MPGLHVTPINHDNTDPRGWPFPCWANKRVFHGLLCQMEKHRLAGWPHPRGSEPLARPAGRRDISGGFPASLQRLPKAVGHWSLLFFWFYWAINWHITLNKFKMYHIMIQYLYILQSDHHGKLAFFLMYSGLVYSRLTLVTFCCRFFSMFISNICL